MKELLKDILYIGAGAAFMTKEKLEELKNELVEKGKISQEEGKQFIDELMKRSEDIRSEMEEKVQQTVAEQMKKMNVARRDDIDALKSEITKLKTDVDKLKTAEKKGKAKNA